jgi:sulfate adenylyltransferase subunit 2
VPLYLAAGRMVVQRSGMLILRDDERLTLLPRETPELRWVRFRTLGCYPLTGAIDSRADTVPAIIAELARSRTSERQGRAIDHGNGSMERKKVEGYF